MTKKFNIHLYDESVLELKQKDAILITLSTLPAIGEFIRHNDHFYLVSGVIHNTSSNNYHSLLVRDYNKNE